MLKNNRFQTTFNKKVVHVGTDYSKFTHDQWQDYRTSLKSLGGSEIGAILGFSKYTSNVELFYKKLGLYQKNFTYRLPMALGNWFENRIVEMMRYYHSDEEVFSQNLDNKIQTMKTKSFKKTLFPLEFSGRVHANIDGLINIPEKEGWGVLEVKKSSQFALDSWENKLNPEYLAQAIFYAGSLHLPYSVLCIVSDNSVEVFIVDSSSEQYEAFKPTINDFIQRLDLARVALEGLPIDAPDAVKYATASDFEPEPFDEQNAPYFSFLTERAQLIERENVIEANDDDYMKCVEILQANAKVAEINKEKEKAKVYFSKRFIDTDASKMIVNGLGSVTFRKGLRFNLKDK